MIAFDAASILPSLLFLLFMISASYQLCLPFSNYCSSCADANNCQTCYYGYGLSSVGGYMKCIACT